MSAIPAKAGWSWLKQGMGLFRKQPGALTTLLFANVLFSLVVGIIPVLGQIAGAVLIPSLSMAFMQACRLIENNQRVTPAVLLTGFRKTVVKDLCKIGLAYLAVSMVLKLVAWLLIDDEFLKQAINPGNPPVVALSDMLGMLLIGFLQTATVIALCFAPPLVLWQRMPPGKAIFFSFFAVLRSARVFLVMLLAWVGILMVSASVLMMFFGMNTFGRIAITWLGFLFVLFLQCAMYVGYRQIFGVPEAAAPASGLR
ncbi:BPSS1780 family membrane protein [Massilia sp. R2A-15]|uniref:BPSS1780 family membrane protein n=1 Tax=Massilia sp. R2A-15 TaxID=3064278 RepID=UPI0027376B43|nr:BPSS1780 family membrane protein [Massilia sp. R2A-15]WLI89767.1 BPSS1780 family membrane protein [Massilia sp. R2A-15]